MHVTNSLFRILNMMIKGLIFLRILPFLFPKNDNQPGEDDKKRLVLWVCFHFLTLMMQGLIQATLFKHLLGLKNTLTIKKPFSKK